MKKRKGRITFRSRISGIWTGMRKRARSRKEEIGFDLESFRDFVAEALDGTGRCFYCNHSLTPRTVSVDHMTPLERGGGWDLGNLCVCCIGCNKAKGRMTAEEYLSLLSALNTFEEGARNEVLGRLKAGASVVRLRFLGGKSNGAGKKS